VNTYEARPWEAGVNRVIAAAARRYPNVVMANWFAAIEHRTSLLWPDEVHPQPSGARLYARTVAGAVRAARTAATTGSASSSGLPPTAHRFAPLG
jgi:lysophospholipase L1-like esterase